MRTWLIILLLSVSAHAEKRLVLFEANGRVSPTYKLDLENIQPNDTIVFGDREFQVKEILNDGSSVQKGSQNFIVDVGGGKAIRFPLDPRRNGLTSIDRYLEGYLALESSSIELPRVYVEESVPGQFAVMEKLDVAYSLTDVLSKKVVLDPVTKAQRFHELVKFSKAFADFKSIGDFAFNQIVWVNGRGWMLLDFQGKDTVPATSGEWKHPFDKFDLLYSLEPMDDIPLLPKTVRKAIGQAIAAERKKPQRKPCFAGASILAPSPQVAPSNVQLTN